MVLVSAHIMKQYEDVGMTKNVMLVAFTIALMTGINASAYELTAIDKQIAASGSDW